VARRNTEVHWVQTDRKGVELIQGHRRPGDSPAIRDRKNIARWLIVQTTPGYRLGKGPGGGETCEHFSTWSSQSLKLNLPHITTIIAPQQEPGVYKKCTEMGGKATKGW